MKELYLITIFYRIHWGFSSRSPWGSAIQPSYALPPPTTIVGALARAYYLFTGTGFELIEAEGSITSGVKLYIDEIKPIWVTASWLAPSIRTGVPISYFSAPYRSRQMDTIEVASGTKPPRELFSFAELGYVVSPHGILAVAVIVKGKDEAYKVMNSALFTSRLGSKESFVDPLGVFIHEVEVAEPKGGIVTAWLTLASCVEGGSKNVRGNYVIETMPLPLTYDEWLCWLSTGPCRNVNRLQILKEVIVPRYPGWIRLKPSKDCLVVNLARVFDGIKFENSSIPSLPPNIIIPRNVLRCPK